MQELYPSGRQPRPQPTDIPRFLIALTVEKASKLHFPKPIIPDKEQTPGAVVTVRDGQVAIGDALLSKDAQDYIGAECRSFFDRK